jgi:outer membrane protein assembly factor BamD
MRTIVTVLAVAAFTGCGSRGPQFSQFDADQLLAYGLDRIEAEEWNDASRALETFIFQYPTHPRYQEVRFKLGDVYAARGEHLSAASEYARLADDFPASELADDARFRVCQEYAEVAPKPQLDQEYTRTAIVHCESLLGFYPDSEFASPARDLLIQLNNKLAEKLYLTGRNYQRQRLYDSAIIYYNDVLATYPASASAPRALLGLYEAYTAIGYSEDADAARGRLLRDFPDSDEARRVGGGPADSP